MDTQTLVLIDLQNDYFPGGAFALDGADQAVRKAAQVLAAFRRRGLPVAHVRHVSQKPGATFFLPGTPGADIHPLVAPLPEEPVVVKHHPNSFRETDLRAELDRFTTTHLVVCGMMTLMCVDATVRQAADLGYAVTVLGDACVARSLTHAGRTVAAADVHAAFLAALGMGYAQVTDTDAWLA